MNHVGMTCSHAQRDAATDGHARHVHRFADLQIGQKSYNIVGKVIHSYRRADLFRAAGPAHVATDSPAARRQMGQNRLPAFNCAAHLVQQ